MSLLLPLGLLGLLGIGVLILIYLIRPNYQQKFISSTYVWILSLQYRKRRIPINRIRNILIFLCQLLILAICALLMAQPVIAAEKQTGVERVVIIDGSASMLVQSGGSTRFERAVDEARDLAQLTAEQEGAFTLIVADSQAYISVQRATRENLPETLEAIGLLVDGGNLMCSYGVADMDGAVTLADEVLSENPEAEVLLYTATTYIDMGGIDVRNVGAEDEWNAAVMNCTAALNEGYYDFSADVGCYGRSEQITVYCEVSGPNGSADKKAEMSKQLVFDPTMATQTVTFDENDQLSFFGERIATFDSVYVHINVADSFENDNFYYLYGGVKPTIRIQYASSDPNVFFGNALSIFRELVKDNWDIDLKQVKSGEEFQTEGFDFYIFEHSMPAEIPTDGAVFLIDPQSVPTNGGFELGKPVNVASTSTLASGLPHPVTNRITPSDITVAQYRPVVFSEGFDELMYYEGQPVFIIRNEPNTKVAVFSINLHTSNLALLMDFPLLIYNTFNYFIPSTFSGYSFEVGDKVTLNARGEELLVSGPGSEELFKEFPGEFNVALPGTYTLTQTSLRGVTVLEQFFASIPASESNITKEVDALLSLNRVSRDETEDFDLLLYLAAAMLALLFAEWWLQSREYLR